MSPTAGEALAPQDYRQVPDAVHRALGADADPLNWNDIAEQNAQQRQKALAWLETSPLPRLMVLRTVMSPLSSLLHDHLQRGSDTWQHEQRASVAGTQVSGADPEGPRQSALLEYIHLSSEKRFMAELHLLRQDARWEHIPVEQHTRKFQAVVFRMLSRMGCLIQELMIAPTSRFPLQLFKIIEGGRPVAERLSRVLEDCPCILDAFTSHMLETFPGVALAEGDGLALLQSLALLTPVETGHLERSHGRVSRLLRSQSVQTRRPTFSFLNAQQVCRKYKERVAGTSTAKAKPTSRRASSLGSRDETGPEGESTRRGGGGAWRAFLSAACRGSAGRSDFGQLQQEYAAIKAEGGERWQRLEEVGRAATELHKETGLPSFGQPTRQIRRKMETHAAQVRAQAGELVPSDSSSGVLRTGGCLALSDSFRLAQEIKQVRQQAREAGKRKHLEK